jgi:PIN domain nuclease of toxin-antitoxin system
MAFLLDTHAALWALTDSARLSAAAKSAITAKGAVVLVSPVSAYEMAFKAALGKMAALPASFSALAAAAGLIELQITSAHAERAARLPLVLRDPWDRFLAAQTIEIGGVLVTRDENIAKLGVRTFW